jgi:hypothetical protein
MSASEPLMTHRKGSKTLSKRVSVNSTRRSVDGAERRRCFYRRHPMFIGYLFGRVTTLIKRDAEEVGPNRRSRRNPPVGSGIKSVETEEPLAKLPAEYGPRRLLVCVTGWVWDRCRGFRSRFGRFSLMPGRVDPAAVAAVCDFKSGSTFSAIRLNSSSFCQVLGNNSYGSGENAIWVECPAGWWQWICGRRDRK